MRFVKELFGSCQFIMKRGCWQCDHCFLIIINSLVNTYHCIYSVNKNPAVLLAGFVALLYFN